MSRILLKSSSGSSWNTNQKLNHAPQHQLFTTTTPSTTTTAHSTVSLVVHGFRSSSSSSSSLISSSKKRQATQKQSNHRYHHQRRFKWPTTTTTTALYSSSSRSEYDDDNDDDDDNINTMGALIRDKIVESMLLENTLPIISSATIVPSTNKRLSLSVSPLSFSSKSTTLLPQQQQPRTYSTTTPTTIVQPVVDNISSSSSSSLSLLANNNYTPSTNTTLLQRPRSTKSKSKSSSAHSSSSSYYKSNPAFQTTALAHSLWSYVIRPHRDTIIDATCGNGQDSMKLAELLFGLQHENKNENEKNTNNNDDNDKADENNDCDSDSDSDSNSHSTAQLLCVDVQQLACVRTNQALRDVLPSSIQIQLSTNGNSNLSHNHSQHHNSINNDKRNNNNTSNTVQILQMSHAVLPRPLDASSVGLIVYNLGYLPGVPPVVAAANKTVVVDTNTTTTTTVKDVVVVETHMETTIHSLVEATALLRVRGMISIATYPNTNYDEDRAVKLFVTCLALLSSNVRTWEEEISAFLTINNTTTTANSNSNSDSNGNGINNHGMSQQKNDIAHIVSSAMKKIVQRQQQQHSECESQGSDSSDSATTAISPNPNRKSISTTPPKSAATVTTWRVSQHEKLGTYRAPVLYTVTRIK